jgi:hypothetical protein
LQQQQSITPKAPFHVLRVPEELFEPKAEIE